MANRLATVGSGEDVKCHGFTIIIGDAQALMRRDKDGDGMYGEVSQKASFDFTNDPDNEAVWTTKGFKRLQACSTQDGP